MTGDGNNFEMGEAMLPPTTVKFKINPKNQVKKKLGTSYFFMTASMFEIMYSVNLYLYQTLAI